MELDEHGTHSKRPNDVIMNNYCGIDDWLIVGREVAMGRRVWRVVRR
jgi:hypothetical protein